MCDGTVGGVRPKYQNIHHCHLTGEGRVKENIFVEFSNIMIKDSRQFLSQDFFIALR